MSGSGYGDEALWDQTGYVLSSQYRRDVLQYLDWKPGTPTTIAKHTSYQLAHVSRTLGELESSGVAELMVPEERRKGRIYGLTEEGEELAAFMAEYDLIDRIRPEQ